MDSKEQLWLAAQIYALKVVLQPDWDLQKHARESISMATQFALAVQAEQAGSSSSTHSSNSGLIVPPGTSSSEQHPQSDSTTSTSQQSATDLIVAAMSGSQTAPHEGTDWHQQQSQEQPSLGIQQAPFAPLDPDVQ